MASSKGHRSRAFVGVLVFVALLVAISFALRERKPSATGEGTDLDLDGGVGRTSVSPTTGDSSVPGTNSALAPTPAYDGVLSPDLVIDNPDCVIREGYGAAEGVAAVVIPTPTGSRFSVLDGSGTVFGDELPFNPNHQDLGRRPDGTVVAAFADLRWKQKGGRGPERPEPMWVYLDGTLIHEHRKVLRFGVADDGSSFYTIEPLAGDASLLVIHNLDLRRESHFDLGELFNPINPNHRAYEPSFAGDRGSVIFIPALRDSFGLDVHWFFPVDGSERWSIDPRISEDEPPERASEAMFASSTEVFVTYNDEDPSGGPAFKRIVKRSYGPVPRPGKFTTLWSRTLDLDGMGQLKLSDNGRWLAVGSSHLHVLNAETGETVFAFPTLENLSRKPVGGGEAANSGPTRRSPADLGGLPEGPRGASAVEKRLGTGCIVGRCWQRRL